MFGHQVLAALPVNSDGVDEDDSLWLLSLLCGFKRMRSVDVSLGGVYLWAGG